MAGAAAGGAAADGVAAGGSALPEGATNNFWRSRSHLFVCSPLTPLLCLQVLFTSNAISERKSTRKLSERKRRRLGFNASPLFWTVSISGYEFVGMARDLAAAHDAAATEIQRYVRGRVRSRTILVWPRLHVLESLS